jgi:hypothetical protein
MMPTSGRLIRARSEAWAPQAAANHLSAILGGGAQARPSLGRSAARTGPRAAGGCDSRDPLSQAAPEGSGPLTRRTDRLVGRREPAADVSTTRGRGLVRAGGVAAAPDALHHNVDRGATELRHAPKQAVPTFVMLYADQQCIHPRHRAARGLRSDRWSTMVNEIRIAAGISRGPDERATLETPSVGLFSIGRMALPESPAVDRRPRPS